MKKNFLKYLLLGVFTLSLGAGFVGCKDYDDDIDDLWGAIEDVKKQLSDLSGTTVKEISYNESTGVMTVTMTDNTTKTLNLKQDMVTYTVSTSISGDELTVTITGSDGTSSSDKVTLPTSGDPGSPDPVDEFDPSKLVIKDGIIYYGDEPTGVTLPVEYAGDSYIVALTDGDGAFIGYQVVYDGNPYDFYIADSLPLKSLVFEPQGYLGGIQAMKNTSLAYKAWASQWKPSATIANDGLGEYWYAPVATDTTTISPRMTAFYHLNPASVTKDQIKSISVVSDDANYISRAAASMPSVYEFDIDPENYPGMLMVVFDITAENIKSIDDANNLVTTLAIQAEVEYEGKTTTITSDYAAVYRSILKVFKLALNDKTEVGHNGSLNQRHLYGSDAKTHGTGITNYPNQAPFNGDLSGYAQVAIDSPYDYTLLYDNKAGLDLKELVTVHYREQLDKTGSPLLDEQIMDSKTLAAYGLELRFAKSDYYLGTNLTNQSDFYTLNNGVVTATLYDVDPVNGGIATVGREPLVRVELYDTENQKVVNTGWVKILIIENDPKGIEVPFDRPEFIVNCSQPVVFTTTVQEMNVDIYEEIGMPKDLFHSTYTLKTVNGNGTGNAILANTTDLGTVTQIYDGANNETVLLRWTITPAQMGIALGRAGAAKGVLEATVTYEAPGREDVVIHFTSKVTEAVATIDNHNSTYWNSTLDVVYINAEIPGSQSNLDDFWTDQDWFFKVPTGESLSRPNFNITPASALTDYPADYVWNYNNTNNLQYFYQFKDGYTATETVGATNYSISVNNSAINRNATAPNQSYSYLLATLGTETQIVATIDTYTGIIEYYNGESTVTGGGQNPNFELNTNINPVALNTPAFVTNMNNSFAKLLLNRVAALQSGMMSAEVQVVLHNTCRDIEVTNGIFTAYFFRPVNVDAGTGNDFSDNTIHEIDLTKLAILTDWRKAYNTMWSGNSSFINTLIQDNSQTWNSKTYYTFFQYYDVTSIAVDIDGITTTMGGGTLGSTPLAGINPQLKVENVLPTGGVVQGPTLANINYGVFRYTNSGNKTQSSFQMRLPVVVTYKWGQVTVDVDVTVTP